MKIAAKSTLWKTVGSTVLALAVTCGIAIAPDGFMNDLPNVFKLARSAVLYALELPASFRMLSERIDPTCSECNEP